MKKISIIILTISFLAACYKDTGNYNYKDINEIKITGLAANYPVVLGVGGAGVVRVEPKIRMTEADADPARFNYYWILSGSAGVADTVGTTPVLDTKLYLKPAAYMLFLRIIDPETGVAWQAGTTLTVGTRFSTGIMLIGTDNNGNAEMDMVTMAKDTLVMRGILSNSGLPALHDPVTVCITGREPAVNANRLWVMTKSGSYYLDRETMRSNTSRNFGSITITTDNLNKESLTPILYAPQVKDKDGSTGALIQSRAMMTSDGNIFPINAIINGGDYYLNPVNRLQSDFSRLLKAAPCLWYSINDLSSIMWYDAVNQRFMNYTSFGSATASTIPTDKAGDPFPWDQSAPGRTLVYGENTRNTDGGSNNGNSFAIMKDNSNNHYIYKFYANGATPVKRDLYTVNGAIATNFDKATCYAFSSRRTVIFYVIGNTLYAYDYNKGFERSYTFPQITDEITMIKFDTQIDYGTNSLYIATYNPATKGRLRRFIVGTDPNTVTITPVDRADWDGLVKIKDMNWRAVN